MAKHYWMNDDQYEDTVSRANAVAETPPIQTPYYLTDDQKGTISICRRWDDEVKAGDARAFGDYRGAHICEIKYNPNYGSVPDQIQALANANFIVNSCNAHQELLAKSQRLIEIMEIQEKRHNGEFHLSAAAFYPIWEEAKNEAKNAIAKATGKE